MKTISVSTRIPQEVHDEFEALATSLNVSKAELLRGFITSAVENKANFLAIIAAKGKTAPATTNAQVAPKPLPLQYNGSTPHYSTIPKIG